MIGEGANEMNNSWCFQFFVSSGLLPPGGKSACGTKLYGCETLPVFV
jgi:hypothetical protein